MKPRPTDAEFNELKRKRDEAIAEIRAKICAEQGWNPVETQMHVSHSSECYCACPDGPCQHIWDGPNWYDDKDIENTHCISRTCSRCGEVAIFHDMRNAP